MPADSITAGRDPSPYNTGNPDFLAAWQGNNTYALAQDMNEEARTGIAKYSLNANLNHGWIQIKCYVRPSFRISLEPKR